MPPPSRLGPSSRRRLATRTQPLCLPLPLLPCDLNRWGHNVALLPSHALLISSGKATADGQTYSSAPTSSNYLTIPLSTSFDLLASSSLSTSSSPTVVEAASGSAPPYAWANLETLADGSLLSFGGQLGWDSSASSSGSDSVWRLGAGASSFAQEADGWSEEPMRRVGAASCSASSPACLLCIGLF